MLEVRNVPRAFLEAPLGIWGRGKFRGLVSREGVSSNLYRYCVSLPVPRRDRGRGIQRGQPGAKQHSRPQKRAKTKQKSPGQNFGFGSARSKSSLSCQLLMLRFWAFPDGVAMMRIWTRLGTGRDVEKELLL